VGPVLNLAVAPFADLTKVKRHCPDTQFAVVHAGRLVSLPDQESDRSGVGR
jgi:hypothetical protein